MKKKVICIAILVVLIPIIAAAISMRGSRGTLVTIATATQDDLVSKVSANGRIQAAKKVEITANVMGPVTRLSVREGDKVKAGDFLLEIDPARAKAAMEALEAAVRQATSDSEQTKARANQARNDYRRADANRQAGIISKAEFEQYSTNLAASEAAATAALRYVERVKANLSEAKDSFSKTVIKAPMDGVITAKRIEQGETAVIGLQNQPGTVLLTISDMSQVETELDVDEASIPSIALGQRAHVKIDAYPSPTFEGVVTEVGGSPVLKGSSNESIKFKVKVRIANPPSTIKPGLSAQAEIFTGTKERALAVPLQALVVKERSGEKGQPAKEHEGVYTVVGGVAVFRPVSTGLVGDLKIEITNGLKLGESVIIGPFKALRELKDGDPVRIAKDSKSRK